MVLRASTEKDSTIDYELSEFNAKRDMLVRIVLSNLVLSDEDQKIKKAWLNGTIPYKTLADLLEKRMTTQMYAHPMFEEIKSVIYAHFQKRDGWCDESKIDVKIKQLLKTAAFNKMTEYTLLYKESPSGKPMTTSHLVQ